jgi:hypothetical protein
MTTSCLLLLCPAPGLHCLQTGAAVYQVLPQEEEGMLTRAPADGADSTTRLVIPDDVITSSMMRYVNHAGCTLQAVTVVTPVILQVVSCNPGL